MASIADLEQLLEQIFERSAARLFRTRIQVVQIERRVERAMERSRSGHGARTAVPAHYAVRLHPDDMADIAPSPADAQDVARTLADSALAFARSHGYHLPGRPTVALLADASLDRGRVRVDAVVGAPRRPPPATADDAAAPPGPAVAPAAGASVDDAAGLSAAVPDPPGDVLATPSTGAVAHDRGRNSAGSPAAREPREPGGIRGDGTQTLAFRRPAPEAAGAVLRVFTADGGESAIEVDGRPLTLGRSRDNGLVLRDARVSRHHGRLQTRHGTLVYADLGSTNGSWVNGIRVDEIALGLGDRLLIGDTVLVVETLPD